MSIPCRYCGQRFPANDWQDHFVNAHPAELEDMIERISGSSYQPPPVTDPWSVDARRLDAARARWGAKPYGGR